MALRQRKKVDSAVAVARIAVAPALDSAGVISMHALAVVSSAFGVYAWTAYPSVSGGDAGELLTSACNWYA